MIILDNISKSLEVKLSAAVATTALPVVVNWVDILSKDQSVAAFGETNDTVTGTGAVTLCAAPAANHTRTVKSLTVYNADTTGATVTVQINSSGTKRILVSILLAVGSTLEYVE